MNLYLDARAQEEFEQAVEWSETARAGYGLVFADAVRKALLNIMDYPLGWPLISDELRHYPLRRFSYSIIYHCDADDIVVVSIFHDSRDPAERPR